MLQLLLLRRCCVVVSSLLPPRLSASLPSPLPTPIAAAMPPRKRAARAASASSGSDYEASPPPKAAAASKKTTTKAAAASKKDDAPSKKAAKKTAAPEGPKGLAPGWVKYGNYVIAKTYGTPAASAKIAAFDLDGTLVLEGASWRREKHLGPAKPGDFVFFRRDVPEVLQATARRGEHVAIFSNQGTIRGALDGKNAWKQTTRMDLVHRALGGVPMTVVFATAAKADNDPHRKPGRGMWDLFVSTLAASSSSGVTPDASLTTYVGDAAGRLEDFADSDKKFAKAAGLKFLTPEEFFGSGSDVSEFDSGWKGIVGDVEEEDDDDDEDNEGNGAGGAGAPNGGSEAPPKKQKKESHNAPILAFFSKLCDAYKADAAARGDEGKKNLGFKLGAANKAAASFRNLGVEVTSIEQVKALVKNKELPGVGKASVERLQDWFKTGTCDMFAALEEQRAALADRLGSVAAAKKEEGGGTEVKPAAALASTAATAAPVPPPPPKEEPEENYGALAFA